MLLRALVVFMSLATAIIAESEDKVIKLTSLDWQPYTGKNLPEQGITSAVVRAAFNAMGYKLIIDFFPWNRAVEYGKAHEDYIGYFPEYFDQNIEKEFIFSKSIGTGLLGFIEHKENPIYWKELIDLKDHRIGIISGYVNTADFDKLIADKILKIEEVTSDRLNILKVGEKRIPLAVIDQNVMNHLLHTDPQARNYIDKVQFNAKPLEEKVLYVCFRKSKEGEKIAKIFNTGLKKINIKKIIEHYIQNHNVQFLAHLKH